MIASQDTTQWNLRWDSWGEIQCFLLQHSNLLCWPGFFYGVLTTGLFTDLFLCPHFSEKFRWLRVWKAAEGEQHWEQRCQVSAGFHHCSPAAAAARKRARSDGRAGEKSTTEQNHLKRSMFEHIIVQGKYVLFFLQFYFHVFNHVAVTWDTFLVQSNRKMYFWSLNLYWYCINSICMFAGMSVWDSSKVILSLCLLWLIPIFPLCGIDDCIEEWCSSRVPTSFDCSAYWLGSNMKKIIWKYITGYLVFWKTVQWDDKLQLLDEWKQFFKTRHKNSINNKSDQASAELWARGKWSQCTSWRIWLFKVWKLLVI